MAQRLTGTQIDALRQQLRARFDQLRDEIHAELVQSDQEHYQDLAGQVHDPGDESVADLLVDIGLADIDRHIAEIRDIEAALARMHMGTYGACSDCGDAIALARLQAHPTAKRCRRCQIAYEGQQGAHHRPEL
ncbi:TraR/DksA family transcriptional regulator [Arhodomonas sp. AD133]|uniref:TraR/DksA family transcriptional regulator n=1 Tax=Arhodomonas sp. AD133 TaxID=3415009 RepID=UPI003EC047FA